MNRATNCWNQDQHGDYKNEVIWAFRDEAIQCLKNNEHGLVLPNRMGFLVIYGYKPRRSLVNYHLTKKYGKKILHNNDETDGYVFILQWLPKPFTFKGQRLIKHARGLWFQAGKKVKAAIKELVDNDDWYRLYKVDNKNDIYDRQGRTS